MLHVFLISLKTNPQETHANENPVYILVQWLVYGIQHMPWTNTPTFAKMISNTYVTIAIYFGQTCVRWNSGLLKPIPTASVQDNHLSHIILTHFKIRLNKDFNLVEQFTVYFQWGRHWQSATTLLFLKINDRPTSNTYFLNCYLAAKHCLMEYYSWLIVKMS